MRIISGSHKGRRLIAPKRLPVRPTTDYAKESLFNILRNQYFIEELKVLDLFSGTGNIAYEFASRGAQQVVSVDSNRHCCAFIEKTAKELEFPIKTIKSDVYAFLEKHQGTYDIVFADPPYNFDEAKFAKIAQLTLDNDLLLEDGILIIEHSKHTNLSKVTGYKESRRYGSSSFSFFKKNADL